MGKGLAFLRTSLVCALIAAACAPAIADLAAPQVAGGGQHTPILFAGLGGVPSSSAVRGQDPFLAAVSADLLVPNGVQGVRELGFAGPLDAFLGVGQLQLAHSDHHAENPECTVQTLPPAPDGASLVLSGLMTLGAVHLARNARQVNLARVLHVAVVPDWYHTDAKALGSCVPYSLEQPVQPPCLTEALLSVLETHNRGPCDGPARQALAAASQCALKNSVPRGPPTLL